MIEALGPQKRWRKPIAAQARAKAARTARRGDASGFRPVFRSPPIGDVTPYPARGEAANLRLWPSGRDNRKEVSHRVIGSRDARSRMGRRSLSKVGTAMGTLPSQPFRQAEGTEPVEAGRLAPPRAPLQAGPCLWPFLRVDGAGRKGATNTELRRLRGEVYVLTCPSTYPEN